MSIYWSSYSPPIILVSGCRRSGTTLLRTVLSQHPQLLVHPSEPQFIRDWVRVNGYRVDDIQKAIKFIVSHRLCPDAVTEDALTNWFYVNPVTTWRDFVKGYLAVWAGEAYGTRPIVLKDPWYIRELDMVEHLFPMAKILHIVRDPRANISSQKARWQDASIYECAVWWRDSVVNGDALVQSNPSQHVGLKYESLICDPESTLQTVCDFLEISFMDEMLTFELDTVSFSPNKAPNKEKFTQFDPSRLNLWKDGLSNFDVALTERVCRQAMALYNYDPMVSFTNSTDKIRLYFAHITQKLAYDLTNMGRKIKNII